MGIFWSGYAVHQLLVMQDLRTYEHHQIALDLAGSSVAEQIAEQRNAPQPRHLFKALFQVIADQPAQHQYGAIGNPDARRDGALVGHQVNRAQRLRQSGHLLGNVKHDGVTLVDVRGDIQLDADLFTVDGLERIDLPLAGGYALGGIAARQKRNFLADIDAGLVIVQSHD